MFIMATALLADPLSESFDVDAVPAGWTIDGTSADGWITSNAIIGDHTGNGGYYFMFNCYNEQVGLVGLASTPRLSVSAEESSLDFWVNYFLLEGEWGNSANLYVDITTDEGETWDMGTTDYIENQFGTGWQNILIDLTPYIGENVNVRFNAISDYGSYNIAVDDVTGPSIYETQEIPGVAIDPIPANATTEAAIVQTLEWSAGIGAPTGYKIFFGTTDEPEFIEDVAGNSFWEIPNVLEYSTTYYWQVVPYNAIGDAENCPLWQFTTLIGDAIETFPWSEDFAEADLSSNWPLPGWDKAEGELSENTNMVWDAFGWAADDFANIEEPENMSARVNIYGTGRIHWLVTPSFNFADGADYILNMDMALTQYGNNEPGALGEDDYFAVVISPDNGYTWSTNHVLGEWVYGDEITNTPQNETLTISGYSGLVRLGFYAQSLVTNEDVDLFIDNLNITMDGVLIEAPANLTAELQTGGNVQLNWDSPANSNPDSYNIYRDGIMIGNTNITSWLDDNVDNGTVEYYLTSLYGETESSASNTVTIDVTEGENENVVAVSQLIGNYPNPFNPTTTIKFSSADASAKVELVVFNMKGEKVITLLNTTLPAGEHSVSWDGKDDYNRTVSSGIYFYKMKNSRYTSSKKMILMK